MKKIILSLLLVNCSFFAFAQDFPKPEFKNQPMLLSDGELSKLEVQTAEIKVKVKGLGYGGSQQEISVPGGKSPVVTPQEPSFVIWVDEGVDPESLIVLTKTEFSSKKRNIPMLKISALAGFGARGKSMSDKYHVNFDIEKVEAGVYKITPSGPLETNMEYAFYAPTETNAQQIKIYLFGVRQ
ncbi:hypothetical protein J2X69_002264 [Algoriphagus sp. 4150]|uniref:hypothetical protein n=1 Tax=Algoriphagus sp. 4150 TaxID=2817756 RepID=UPI0028605BB8|nr:hypothetical protein [Algoriphagus sp. 4150]MDR7129918.1 hypothetical protein [Algoriphagus sp. 4150]